MLIWNINKPFFFGKSRSESDFDSVPELYSDSEIIFLKEIILKDLFLMKIISSYLSKPLFCYRYF